jgi:hypothetical protein
MNLLTGQAPNDRRRDRGISDRSTLKDSKRTPARVRTRVGVVGDTVVSEQGLAAIAIALQNFSLATAR